MAMDLTWTYTGEIATVDLDWIRFHMGDTNPNAPLMYDVEVNATLTLMGTKNKAVLKCMETILLRIALNQVDYKIGPESVSASQKYDHYKALYDTVKEQLKAGNMSPQVINVGTSIFNVGMMDEPGSTYVGDDLDG